jgi:transcriptional regulator with XRE-family HTH domain
MNYATEKITSTLREARENKGLSQRELSTKSGVPQGHISKIENGDVDLRASSLVALARVLEMELLLVPRKAVPAVKSIIRSSAQSTPPDGKFARQIRKELAGLQKTISDLPKELLSKSEFERIQRQARELHQNRHSSSDIEAIGNFAKAVKAIKKDPEKLNAIRNVLSMLRDRQNEPAPGRGHDSEIESIRPAYDLDEDDDG